MKETRAAILPKLLAELEYKDVVIIETGMIRNVSPVYRSGDGHSTQYICEFLRDQEQFNSFDFTSIDLSTKVCKKYLTDLGLIKYVNLVEQDATNFLENYDGEIHFAHLDSENDAEMTMREFQIVEKKMAKNGIIIIDDAAIPSKPAWKKGNVVIPYIQESGYNHEFTKRQTIVRGPF